MRTSENLNELAKALAAAQGEMKNATLNKVNPHFKSKYADLAEIRDTITPSLAKHGLALIHGVEPVEGGVHVVSRLVHTSGQWAESRFPLAYDKPQAMGSGITYGRRYNSSALTNISADDDDDANAANDKPAPEPKYARSAIVRAEFERLQKGIHQIETSGNLEDLKLFWQNNAKTIAGLPADWKAELEATKEEAKESLSQKVAA